MEFKQERKSFAKNRRDSINKINYPYLKVMKEINMMEWEIVGVNSL